MATLRGHFFLLAYPGNGVVLHSTLSYYLCSSYTGISLPAKSS